MKKLMLVDGNSMLFRAYYATAYGKKMTTSKGIPTNAVFGFANMLQKAIDLENPDSILVAFDAGKHTFRHELYQDYKGGRKPAPDDLVPQFQLVRDFLDAYHIRWVEMQDIEADDLIGTMAKISNEYNTVIFTTDHDMLQLVDDTTHVLLMKKGITDMDEMTTEKMKEEMGIEPIQIIDLKGLMGDKSDNIPGIPGIGEKTALKLLSDYHTVEGVLEHEDELKGAMQKKVKENHESALLSKKLATIRRDVSLDFGPDDCKFDPDYKSLVNFLETLDMKMLASRYSSMISAESHEDVEAVTEHFKRVEKVPSSIYENSYCIYGDDDHAGFMTARLRGVAVCNDKECVYIDIENLKKDNAFIESLNKKKARGYDIKRLMHVFRNEGIESSFLDDAMIMASLVDSTLTSTEKINERFSLSTTDSYEDIYGKPNKPILIIDEEKQTRFACQTVRNISRIFQACENKITEYDMTHLYRDIELPVSAILADMETEGITCDVTILDEIAERTKNSIDLLQQQIYSDAKKEFNINSPKQLAEVLYDDLGLYTGKKRSTSADVLEKLIGAHPIVEKILAYRKLAKIYSTYAEGLKKYIYKDGKIHTIYNQAATTTGRLSSSEPNLQNISVRDELGKEIRKAFLPEKGCVLLSSDYHQIELRMLAHMADETSLIDAFCNNIDIHTKTAMDVFNVEQDEVTSDMRRQAKTVNFGIVYGISDFGLSEQLGVSVKQARDFIQTYYEKYPRILTYMNELVENCERDGYVTTLLNRRREIPEIHDKNRMVKEFGKRAAMNAPIQGSAADLIKIAMIHIDEAMKQNHVRSKMILQVHDELIFNVPEDEIEVMTKLISDGMEHAMTLKVPLSAECSIGHDWYEAK